jgi:uncharacterized membrane protein YhiD involved in acid resistance
MKPQRKREIVTLIIVFTGVLVMSGIVVYLIGNRGTSSQFTQVEQPAPAAQPGRGEPLTRSSPTPTAPQGNETFLDHLMGSGTSEANVRGERWVETMGRIALRLLLAGLLGAGLAYRPRRKILALKQNPYVSQTQILLAIVAAALMIIVGDNAARAFGIFAAVSLVRFRTNIRDPKEVTVLLICMALGLAAGVGRWDLGVVLAVFSLFVLWLMEWREPEQVFRSMELKVITKNVVLTQRALREVFKKHGFDKELRAVDREATEESPGSIAYSVDVSPTVSTDELSADILALDGQNVEGIEWNQKKSYSYLYQ